MGLLDNIISDVAGGQPQGGAQVLAAIGSLLNSNAQGGGLTSLIAQFTQAGFGQHIQSWISSGQNLPISTEQITQALGSGRLQQLAQDAGIDPAQMSGHLAQLLPQLVDHLTPNGQVPQGGGLDVLGVLARLAGR